MALSSISPREAAVSVRGLSKAYRGQPVHDGLNLDLRRGDILSVFGPNGCGKSTLINMMAGLLEADAGSVLFDGRTVREARIGYVFQNYREALLPWRRAADNIRYPLKLMGQPRARIEQRLEALSSAFQVRFDLNRYPYEMSGGQQQLVSVMRALAVEPEVLFLDEPFSALDYETTLSLRELLGRVLKENRITAMLVSHDLEESIALADRVLMLTRRPARIVDDVPVPLAWPRDAATLSSPEFVAIKKRCLDVFTASVRARPEAA